ncbi:tyrosine-type recombinase/integrase [Acetobacterium fimetarium]|uniref:Tyrosine-type recombinase/integrase n=1 Tax=Acetobacterium fimetarium TaxID=52691 RepID=A0ABR6WRT4_9FIRM|nr:tyrosine-type recombinase/integrase [Acetobacterium fimetarium]MBC3803346.1 tyrosine-type recombinase/integrase [Acetobacterium fimetarium]
MANIEKRGTAYRIVVSCGYDTFGKQIKRYLTYNPPEGITQKQLDKELNKIAVEFEEKCTLGYVLDSNVKLIDFIEIWFKDYVNSKNLSPVTINGYQALSIKIVEELGHIKIGKITPKHVQDFYAKIKNSICVKGGKKFKVTDHYLKLTSTMKQKDISSKAGISDDTLRRLKKGGNTTLDIAQKITKALELDFDILFASASEQKLVTNDTVLHYHRLLNNIMNTAVRWGVIPFNVIEKRVELPRLEKKEPQFMDDKEALELLILLDNEPIKYKLAINLLIFSGLRRGEIGGLKWDDVDFESSIITVKRSLKYIPGEKTFEGNTKTYGSMRSIKLPDFIFELFKSYRVWQLEERFKVGDRWINADYIFTKWNGEPMNLDTTGKYLKKFTEKHNLKPVHLHSLRHTNATILIASGVDLKTVSTRLGHSNVSTTGDIYAHAINSADAKASDAMENILIKHSHKTL